MTDLIFGAPEVSTDMFAAIPTTIGDPFLYVEHEGRRIAVLGSLDHSSVRDVAPDVELLDPRAFGIVELIRGGMPRRDAEFETFRKILAELGAAAARVSWSFPVGLADRLREGGIALTIDGPAFDQRRRVKTPSQLDGIRRAQAAADAAMAIARDLVHACQPGLTAEDVRGAMQRVAADLGAELPDDVMVAVNGQAAEGHNSGSGPIAAGDCVLVDIWPQDRASRCWADMTRTFVAGGGEPNAELAELWDLCRRALADVTAAARAGVHGSELHRISCEPFEAVGKPTQRSAAPGTVLEEGYFHSLGHGVGLDIHEAPGMGLSGDELVAGDVIAVEPGCYRKGFGGVRLEDLLLITEDGCEVLTQFAYEL